MKPAFVALALVSVASALPALPKLTPRELHMLELGKRQNKEAEAAGLTDNDILQFALTLEWLEATFYQEGFKKFPPADFTAIGLNDKQLTDLLALPTSEFSHASFLQGSLAQGGITPVQPCTYNFGFTDAKSMVVVAAVLENVGVSAYLGAASLVSSSNILTAAGSILTTEARHQTFIRTAAQLVAVPQAFDAPLTPRMVFTLAAPFITSCPEGSNLAITPFSALSVTDPAAGTPAPAGTKLTLKPADATGATHCAFTSGGVTPGGSVFAPFDAATNSCAVPQGVAGVTYVSLVNSAPLTGVVNETSVVAGPTFILVN
ncbi:Protein rds1 [Ceratocystis platani]|uniref:Protein rds1 n=1 Tax=Ceratocystis fimbriata f. sp. platani TaxID=88771 RepID=A0A0F8DIS3_CERFI|nr:Protein rds1 [Ceratocystis platani]